MSARRAGRAVEVVMLNIAKSCEKAANYTRKVVASEKRKLESEKLNKLKQWLALGVVGVPLAMLTTDWNPAGGIVLLMQIVLPQFLAQGAAIKAEKFCGFGLIAMSVFEHGFK